MWVLEPVLTVLETKPDRQCEHALIALLALAVGLSFGLSYGLETHTSYLLHPLREINPRSFSSTGSRRTRSWSTRASP